MVLDIFIDTTGDLSVSSNISGDQIRQYSPPILSPNPNISAAH
jgi:hypothetical protein